MNTPIEHPKVNVLGIGIDAINMEKALEQIEEHLVERRKGYVCLVGVHGVMEAQRDAGLAKIYASAALAAPDGMPTVWVGHHQGHAEMERVAGPDLMLEVIANERLRGFTHFLCGGKDGVAEELRDQLIARYPLVKIAGTFTPPVGPMSPVMEQEFVATINRLRPNVVWVGISTPKQERFMNHYLPLLDTTLMFGVGAAFDFHTGRIRDCAEWIKRAGLQWLDRLLQDPKHLWRRYLRNNPSFLFYIFLQLTGIKPYSIQSAPDLSKTSPQPAWAEQQSLP